MQNRLRQELHRQQLQFQQETKIAVADAETRVAQKALQESQQRLEELKELKMSLAALDQVFSWHSDYENLSHKVN